MMKLSDRGITKKAFNLDLEKLEHYDIVDNDFWTIYTSVYDYTELSTAASYNLYCTVKYIINNNVPGDLIECGVHMGGSIMLIALTIKKINFNSHSRKIFALDTFCGFLRRNEDYDVDLKSGTPVCFPESSKIDYSFGSIENMHSIGYSDLKIIKGDVFNTIPTLETDDIALLRLDTDTYDTTKFELEMLYEKVTLGGCVIIDDYGFNSGCKLAVDDFINGKNILLNRINSNVRVWTKI
jgi:O-methyltransferase